MIRDGTKLCKNIISYDANALYPYVLSQDMPCGTYTHRSHDTGFKIEKPYCPSHMAMVSLGFIMRKENMQIQHYMNYGEQILFGFHIDGICRHEGLTPELYEFHSCLIHGHACHLTKNKTDFRRKPLKILHDRMLAWKTFLEDKGFKVIELYECQWYAMLNNDPELAKFAESFDPPFE